MIRKHTVALGLSACFILSGCNDKIEEANKTPEKPAVESSVQTMETPSQPAQSVSQLPALDLSPEQHAAPRMKDTVSVADLYAKKQELSGKVVVVEGNVVKVSDGIMGKSWVHIQDGTGGKETNDVVFTSATQSATVGDHIIAKGTVSIDKDFGYGYFYSVIVENAVFSK